MIANISAISGIERSSYCSASKPRLWFTKAFKKPAENFLNDHVDWSAEALIGYKRRS